MSDLDIKLAESTDQDWDALIAFMRAFCEEDGHQYGPENEAALRVLAGNPHHGRAFVIWLGDEPIGYAALCYGYSLEFHGRDGFLDELYITPEHRGLGIASTVLEELQSVAQAEGIKALHLEVMIGNDRAARLYRRNGWMERDSRMMSKLLKDPGSGLRTDPKSVTR